VKNIVFFGDSLTAGYQLEDPVNESVPGLIQQKIIESGLDYKVYNAGLSGSTSGGGLARLDHWLKKPIDVFVLELGINDLIRQIPVEVTQANLEKIIKYVKRKNPNCKLAIMGMRLPNSFKSAATAGFNEIYHHISENHHAAYVPFFLEGVAGKHHLNLRDGMHPNADGYRIISDKIWPILETVLKEGEESDIINKKNLF
jgi:acyl-CoA thioesterase-1